jgi:hypothetical protein
MIEKLIRGLIVLFLLSPALLGQQPTSYAPVFPENAQYLQGRTWADYKPSAASGLTLSIAAGTAYCGNPPAPVYYPGGTLTMTASGTNYVYLDPAATCAPAFNTTGFAVGQIPLAKVVTGASTITSVTDARTWFVALPCVMSSTGAVQCSAGGTNQNITLTPSGTGFTIVNGNLSIGNTDGNRVLKIRPAADTSDVLSVVNAAGTSENVTAGADASGNGRINIKDASNTSKIVLSSSGNSNLSGGNVGIGTTTPTAGLQIVSVTGNGVSPKLRLTDNAPAGKTWEIQAGIEGISDACFDILNVTDTVQAVVIQSGGNVGIGTTTISSGQKLEVNGGIALNTATAKPTCSATTRGTFWVTQNGAGVKDDVEVCAKDATDAYAWRTIY